MINEYLRFLQTLEEPTSPIKVTAKHRRDLFRVWAASVPKVTEQFKEIDFKDDA
jgi:hypothetical protein